MSGLRYNRCVTGVNRTVGQGQPAVEYAQVTLQFPAIGFPRVMSDQLITFLKPHKIIGVSSVKTANRQTNIYMHFYPLNRPIVLPAGIGSIAIVPNGDEFWIPLSNVNSSGVVEGRYIKFTKPVQSFLYDVDHPNGGIGNGVIVTFFGADDIGAALLERV